jgi:aspartate/methionine/tyrosine aminotransferase
MMPDPSAHNSLLAQFAPGLWRSLSPLARRLAFPRGIVFQAEQAHAATLNATIGQVTDGHGAPMPLRSLEAQLGPIDRKVALLYAPMAGNAELRELWRAWQAHAAGHPLVSSTLPYMTHGLTHGLSMLADLLIDADTTLVLPEPAWENYDLVFGMRAALTAELRVVRWRFFRDGKFDPLALGEALAGVRGKAVVVLNFPSNPTGYSPTAAEAATLVASLCARSAPTAVIVDDAYQGVVHTSDAVRRSLFWDLAAAANPEHTAVFKVDGATKELMFFPCRVGFVTAALPVEAHAAWEGKLKALARATAGSPPGPSQALMLPLLREPDRTRAEAAARIGEISERWRVLNESLAQFPQLRTYPFNAAYFALIRLPDGADADAVRLRLLREFGVGSIAIPEVNALRVAYCSLALDDLPELAKRLHAAIS